jgi:hypothetical protein
VDDGVSTEQAARRIVREMLEARDRRREGGVP